MQQLEVPLREGQNQALVDLFYPLHARRVLAEFGKAYGRLTETLPAKGSRFKFMVYGECSEELAIGPQSQRMTLGQMGSTDCLVSRYNA